MRAMILASVLLAGAFAGSAEAKDSRIRCEPNSGGQIVAASEVRKGLEDLGYRVDRIKEEHGCYEVVAVNDSGFPIKAHYSVATGELLRARLR